MWRLSPWRSACDRGDWLFREGDPADAVYLVRLGHVEVLKLDEGEHGEQEDHPINTLTRGAVLGELALLERLHAQRLGPRPAGHRAARHREGGLRAAPALRAGASPSASRAR